MDGVTREKHQLLRDERGMTSAGEVVVPKPRSEEAQQEVI
jgi:hypothetical protein